MSLGQQLHEALRGPGHLRFIVQPAIALLLGIRDGRLDYRAGKPPYGQSLLGGRGRRGELAKAGLSSIVLPLCLAIVIDALVQFIMFRSVKVWIAVVTGILLIATPYILARGLTNRAFRLRRVKRA
jgi:hypothetical protein